LHQGNNISTPAIEGTILPGITRKSVFEVDEGKGYKVVVHLFMGFSFQGINGCLKLRILVVN
jgi:hypothetical protein